MQTSMIMHRSAVRKLQEIGSVGKERTYTSYYISIPKSFARTLGWNKGDKLRVILVSILGKRGVLVMKDEDVVMEE